MNVGLENPAVASASNNYELFAPAQVLGGKISGIWDGRYLNWEKVNERLEDDYSLSASGCLIHKTTHLKLGVSALEYRRLIKISVDLMHNQSTTMVGFRLRGVKYIANNGDKSLEIFRLDSIINQTAKNVIFEVTLMSTGYKYIFKCARIRGGSPAKSHIANEVNILDRIHALGPALGIMYRPKMTVDFNALVKGKIFRNYGMILDQYSSDYFHVLKKRDIASVPFKCKLWETYQLLAGLKYIADLNVCHLDIKPENILIAKTKSGRLFLHLSDFGTAFRHQKDAQSLGNNFNFSHKYVIRSEIKRIALLLQNKSMDLFIQLGKKIDVLATGIIMYSVFTAEFPPKMYDIHFPINQDIYDPLKKNAPEQLYDLIIKMLRFSDLERISAGTAFDLFYKFIIEHEPMFHQNIQEFVLKHKYVNFQIQENEKLEAK